MVCFPLLKRAYSSWVQQYIVLNKKMTNKLDFLSIYQQVHQDSIKSSTITSTFSVTGLISLDPDCMLMKLNICLEQLEANININANANTENPTLLESQYSRSSTFILETPYTIKALDCQGIAVKQLIYQS